MVDGLEVAVRHRLSRLDLDAELSAPPEGTLALVGPSGAGKSSILRAIAGLLEPNEGRISLHGRALFDSARRIHLPPEARRVGLVFQDAALFPHLTVAENVGYGIRRRPRHERARQVGELLERFGIAPLAAARPGSLSGGERQRVALARAMATDPEALLLDEPLSALDPATKARVAHELAAHLREVREMPTVLVSHDFADVAGLADAIAVIEAGRIVQRGTAAELLQAPASAFVAALTGVNYFVGVARPRGGLTEIRTADGRPLFLSVDEAAGLVGVAVSPWDVALSRSAPEGSALNALQGPVSRVASVGNRVRVTVAADPPVVAEITEESVRRLGIEPGVPVVATWKASGTRLVPAAS